ncbi:MAG: LamG-like jellyroll fold domain-containing protein, partial [Planctomycetota bacterium]
GDTAGGTLGNTEPLVLAASTTTSSTGDHEPLTDYFEGYIDDVRVYENPLGENQVTDLYNDSELSENTDPGVTVVDTSGQGAPLDLDIADPDSVAWIDGGGLTIHTATQISSPGAATKIFDALTATNRMTIELVFTPENLTQNGSARIATYSENPGTENFIVGQNRQAYAYRVRTTSTGSNGMPSLESSDTLSTTGRHHFVATYDETEIRIYRDGALEMTEPRTGSFATWDNTLIFTLANDAQGSRPWLGTLYRVAVYDEALSNLQLQDLFIGAPPDSYEAGEGDVGYEARWVEEP